MISIYIVSKNYGLFLNEAIESVLKQTFTNWNLILINDGSTDDTIEIFQKYKLQYPSKISHIINFDSSLGLRNAANHALRLAKSKYIIRLDADDYFDENALLIMYEYMERNPDIALFFSDWIYVDIDGKFIGKETRKKIGSESNVLDLAAHGACSLIRTSVIRSIGGYDCTFDTQDGYELWLKIIRKYKVANTNTPLFYYRKHGDSMSSNDSKLINSRRVIKESLFKKEFSNDLTKKIAIIPVRNKAKKFSNISLELFNGKTLLDRTIEVALACNRFDKILLESDDRELLNEYGMKYSIFTQERQSFLLDEFTPLPKIIYHSLSNFENENNQYFDIVSVIGVNSPLKESHHLNESIDTLFLMNVDHVISTYEDLDAHFMHSENGMKPINPKSVDLQRYERETLYVNNGAVHTMWRYAVNEQSFFYGKIGHFVMEKNKSYQVKSKDDLEFLNNNL
jgi:CMP-N-acetylneuraminic acid synthetase/GT2 family glycosyltransferase